ncbi:MAG: hypothetical protein VW713_10690 [Alphaproteobacteria bacterium]
MNARTTFVLAALIAGLSAPAAAQQVVETSTGRQLTTGECSVSQAMLAAIEDAQANREAETRAKVDALLEAALASPKTAQVGGEPAVASPPRNPGS